MLTDELLRDFADLEIVQTHISLVFLRDYRAYKVKRPVRFAFVDLTDPERRRALCHEELRLNQAHDAANREPGLLRVGAVIDTGMDYAAVVTCLMRS